MTTLIERLTSWGRGARASVPFVVPMAESDALQPSAALYGPTVHRAANFTENNTKDWSAPTASADADLDGERETITGRARDVIRNNGFAAGLARTEVDSVLGAGGVVIGRRATLGCDVGEPRDEVAVVDV